MMELYLFVALFFNLCPDVSDGGQVCDAPGVDGGFFGFFIVTAVSISFCVLPTMK